MGRAPCCDKANVKRGPWSPEEDATLKNYIENYGTGGNWISLPSKAGLKRCGKSCRLRWLNYLRPDIKHGGFTEEEDDIICTLYATIGSRWSFIASQLPGRTDNDVKNYWNTKLKKKQLVPKIDVSNEILRDNNSATHDPIPKYWDSIAQIEAHFNPDNSDSAMEILDNHKYYCDQQGLFLDQTQFRPVSTLMDVQNFSFGCNSVSPSQQVSSFSPSSSSLVLPLDNNCGGSVQAIDGILPYFGFESPNYELLNDIGLQ